jgi:hypothetical protein
VKVIDKDKEELVQILNKKFKNNQGTVLVLRNLEYLKQLSST